MIKMNKEYIKGIRGSIKSEWYNIEYVISNRILS